MDELSKQITEKVNSDREACKLRARVALDKMMKEWREENAKEEKSTGSNKRKTKTKEWSE